MTVFQIAMLAAVEAAYLAAGVVIVLLASVVW